MTSEFEPAQYGKGIGAFITKILYSNPLIGIRELITNAADEYLDPNTRSHENYNRIDVILDLALGKLIVRDYAGGIRDLDDFKRFFSKESIPSKRVAGEISTLQVQHDQMAGLYHIGKASVVKMSKRRSGLIATFRSNSNERGGDIVSLCLDESESLAWDSKEYNYEKQHAHLVKPELGLTVEVFEIVDDLRSIEKLEKEISKRFGLRIVKGLNILLSKDNINFKKIEPPSGLLTNETLDVPQLRLGTRRYVTYAAKQNLKPKYQNIDVYKHYIYVKSIHSDAAVEGWINCNDFELTGARDDFQTGKDTTYTEGIQKVDSYFRSIFGKQHTGLRHIQHKAVEKQLERILIAANKIFPDNPLYLRGIANSRSVALGEITAEEKDETGKWQQKHDKKLINKGGDINGDPFTTIGPGHRHRGRIGTTGKGPNRSYEENGDHTIIEKTEGGTAARRTGKVQPHARIVFGELPNDDKRICVMTDDSTVVVNTGSVLGSTVENMPEKKSQSFLTPHLVEAAIEYQEKDSRMQPLPIAEFRAKCSVLLAEVITI